MFIVYTEILGDTVERYFYGEYTSRKIANFTADQLGCEYPVAHCACTRNEAEELGVKNLPERKIFI